MTTGAGQQRRGRKIAMTKAELDDFLVGHRICRVATVGSGGPYLTALWYVWELRGMIEVVGEIPRTGIPDERLTEPERLFARKYAGADVMHHDGRHAWLSLVPDTITSWDFRKLRLFTQGGRPSVGPRAVNPGPA
jgi:hypothetical protein